MNRQFAELVRLQWSRVRVPVILVTLLLFTIPLTILRPSNSHGAEYQDVGEWLRAASLVGRVFPVIAMVLGLYLGLAAWADDTKGRHVYALTLPVSRERYVIYRFIAGALPIFIATLGLLAGSGLASAIVRLPAGIHAYPLALAVRSLIATLVCYSVFFAIGIATRRAVLLVLGVFLALILAEVVAGVIGVEVDLIGSVIGLLTRWPGPFAILLGNWSLFDV